MVSSLFIETEVGAGEITTTHGTKLVVQPADCDQGSIGQAEDAWAGPAPLPAGLQFTGDAWSKMFNQFDQRAS